MAFARGARRTSPQPAGGDGGQRAASARGDLSALIEATYVIGRTAVTRVYPLPRTEPKTPRDRATKRVDLNDPAIRHPPGALERPSGRRVGMPHARQEALETPGRHVDTRGSDECLRNTPP